MGRKRSRSEGIKYCKATFGKGNYFLHHARIDSAKHIKYCGLDAATKKTFFAFFEISSSSSSHSTMDAFVGSRALSLRVLINEDIVNIIIRNLIFHPEDINSVSLAFLLSSFAPTLDPSEKTADAGGISKYAIFVDSSKRFQLFAGYLGAGLSFRQVTQVILDLKELLGNGSIGSISKGTVSHYALSICAKNLQSTVGLLRKFRKFSVAIDMATHMAIGYCNIRIRICHESAVHDLHLLTIHVHGRHVDKGIFSTFGKTMDALCSDWCEKSVGASSDGERTKIGRHQGVITRILHVATPALMRVWHGAHQVDLCMQSVYFAFPDKFYSKFTIIVSCLRRYQNFVSNERSNCPLICDTH